ncbi:MAG: radical SAM protein [Verrucomicrobiota bacterium]|nr:radical SAM protein [Verrucomicrobiota bacterium]
MPKSRPTQTPRPAGPEGDPPGLVLYETYRSIQGESTWVGIPCTFIRLAGCHLRCSFCDTEYAFHGGRRASMEEVLALATEHGLDCVEVTGGEPLLQRGVYPLMTRLCDMGAVVLLETSGSISIEEVDPRVHVILDFKCPSSGEVDSNYWPNVALLRRKDEVKFVIGDRADFEWARDRTREHRLNERVGAVLFSPVFGLIEPQVLVEWILEERLGVRFQIQLHKVVWPPDQRGV